MREPLFCFLGGSEKSYSAVGFSVESQVLVINCNTEYINVSLNEIKINFSLNFHFLLSWFFLNGRFFVTVSHDSVISASRDFIPLNSGQLGPVHCGNWVWFISWDFRTGDILMSTLPSSSSSLFESTKWTSFLLKGGKKCIKTLFLFISK